MGYVDFSLISTKGEILYLLNKTNEAYECFKESLSLKENSASYLFISRINLKRQKYKPALKILTSD